MEREAATTEVGAMTEDVGGGRNQVVRPDVLDRARAEYVELAARMHQDVARLLDDLELNRGRATAPGGRARRRQR
jgi:hypothetical protein